MADIIVRVYNFVDGQTAYGSQVEAEIENIADVLNELNAGTSAWERVYASHATSVPLIADNLAGSQNIAEFKNNNATMASVAATGAVTLVPTSNQLVLGTTRTVTLTAPTPASASRTVTLPDLSANYSVVGTAGTQTVSGTKTFDGQLIGKGTATNDSAAAGMIGEYVSSVFSSVAAAATGDYKDMTTISLTAGDWDVSLLMLVQGAGVTITGTWDCGISIGTAGNAFSDRVSGSNAYQVNPAAVNTNAWNIPNLRLSLSSTTTVRAKLALLYSSGSPTGDGRLSARRVR